MSETPGAQTPWSGINRLLGADERFEVHRSHWKGFLLAPKHTSQLAALLYFLHQEEIPFCVQGRGTSFFPADCHSVIVSARAFLQTVWHDHGAVGVGAGCSVSHLNQFLLEVKQETPLEADPLASPKRSVGGVILSGRVGGIRYRRESIPETILGVELVTREGSQVKWGGVHRTAMAGPALHKLMDGLDGFSGIIVKVMLKTNPIPPVRLQMTWSFRRREELWDKFQELKNFSLSWEYLDAVLSGESTDQEFIFAQISGLPEEMEAFSQRCPGYAMIRRQDERMQLKNFLMQQRLNAHLVSRDHAIASGEYLWFQEYGQKAWWLTRRTEERKDLSPPIWKQRFLKSLFNNANFGNVERA